MNGSAVLKPDPHPSGARPPIIPPELLPVHAALVMDGNGRWAKDRGLPRTDGHQRGEAALFDVIEGAIEIGIRHLSVYAFSTENWKRSPEEVRFLMGFSRNVLRRRRDALIERGVRVLWAGRPGRLWRSVIQKLRDTEQLSRHNSTLDLQFCVNYGGQAEIADAISLAAKANRKNSANTTSHACSMPPTGTHRADLGRFERTQVRPHAHVDRCPAVAPGLSAALVCAGAEPGREDLVGD